MHSRRRPSRAPSEQPPSQSEKPASRGAPAKRSASKARNPRSRGTTPISSAHPGSSTTAPSSSRRRPQTTVPSLSQQIGSPQPVEDEVVWSSQLEENDFDDTEYPPRPQRTSGPMLASLSGMPLPTQDTDLGALSTASQAGPGAPSVATQIWSRGMGVLGAVPEDSLEAEEDSGGNEVSSGRDKGKRRVVAEEADRTPTQAQVNLSRDNAATQAEVPAGAVTRTGSVVSQLPGIAGLPGSFEGMSGIGGQNEFGTTQFEESLPVLKYNSRSALSGPDEGNGGVDVSFNPAIDLADPAESQVVAQPHSDIVYNRSGNPIARSSGEPLRPENDEILGPVVRSAQYRTDTTEHVAASTSGEVAETSQSTSQSQSQSPSSSHRRKKIQFGEYDPADDLVSFEYDPVKHGEDPNRDRTGEPTGPVYQPPVPLTAEEEAERARGKKFLFEDDVRGNLEFGREKQRQMVLDRHVRPLREIRAARGGSNSPSRSSRVATAGGTTAAAGPSTSAGPSTHTRPTGPSLGDEPENPVRIDDPHTQTPSPELTWTQMEEVSRMYIREVIIPDRRRRENATGLEDDENGDGRITRQDSMHGISLAQPPPFPLIYHESDEDDLGGTQNTPGPAMGGTVLVPNSSGSVGGLVEDDSPVPGEDAPRQSYMQKASQEEARISGWHQHVDDEQELDEDMDFLFPPRHLEPPSEKGQSHLAKMFAKKAAKNASESRLVVTSQESQEAPAKGKGAALSKEPSASSSLGVGEGMSSVSKEFPPNQQALMQGRRSRSDLSLVDSSADPTQASKAGPTQSSALVDSRPAHISRYPNPDALSISTDDSVMRSQLYSSRIAVYNADQAGLKPGDEGYSAPAAEENYVQWSRNNRDSFSDIGSAASAVDTKGKQAVGEPMPGATVRMPETRGLSLSNVQEESRVYESSGLSGESTSIVADSQEESQLAMESVPVRSPQKPSEKSTKTTDPRRRPPAPTTTTGVIVSSEAGPSRHRPTSPAKPGRQEPQTPLTSMRQPKATTGPALVNIGLSAGSSDSLSSSFAGTVRSKTPAEGASVIAESNSMTSGSVIRSIEVVDPSPYRSDAEAQIEADLVPETQYTQRSSRASSPVLGVFSPVIRYERTFERGSRQATVLVPGSASATQASNLVSRGPSRFTPGGSFRFGQTENEEEIMANIGGQNESSLGSPRRVQQEESFSTSGAGTQIVGPADASSSSGPVTSFELPDPPRPARVEQSTEREKVAVTIVTGRGVMGKPPPKDTRTVPTAPAPLPEPSEPIRRTRSVPKRPKTPPAPRGPMKVPVPPPPLAAATRAGKQSTTARVASPQPAAAPLGSDDDSSPLPSLTPSPERGDKTTSPVRRRKSYLKVRTLVQDSSAEIIEAPAKQDASERQGDPETSGSLDPFKDLVKTVSKTRTRPDAPTKAQQEIAGPPAGKSTISKRVRPESPVTDELSSSYELTPPAPKKRREDAVRPKPTKENIQEATVQATGVGTRLTRGASVAAAAAVAATSRPASTSYRACQQGGRVFALRGKFYYTASVTNTWEDDSDEIMCRVEFDDDSSGNILLTALYRCELREGDEVRVPGKKGGKLGRVAHVSAVPSWEERAKVSVRVSITPKEEVLVINGKDMAVAAAVVKKEWNDRKATSLEDIGLGAELVRAQEEAERKLEEAKASGRRIPSTAMMGPPRWKSPPVAPPTRAVTLPPRGKKRPPTAMEEPSVGPSSKRRRLLPPPPTQPFTNHLFILALAVYDKAGAKLGDVERSARKDKLTADIERLGGRVVDGFEDLLNWGGQISDDADRWIWDNGDLQYVASEPAASGKGKKRGGRGPGSKAASEPAKLFLIADVVNRNVKYMMALATGVPCVHKGWIDDQGSLAWTSYLLPAGECLSLEHPCSQLINEEWYDQPRTLGSLLETPGRIRKALKGKSILFVYPSRSGTKMEEDKFSHIYVYPSLACLMGASRVEAVHNIKAASLKLKEYDAIVYEHDDVPVAVQKSVGTKYGGNVICAGFSWVSDCLISGSYLILQEEM